jgi:hypothetical protein
VGAELGLAVALGVEEVLPLPDHAEVAVVDDGDLDRIASRVQVASSWLVIWKQPSPSIAQTVASGRPLLAPMAAGIA